MSKIKRFIQTALTYLAGNILSKLVTFFLIPLYTNKLTTGDYGDYDVVVTIITLLVAVAFFQIWDGMFRMSFDVEDTEDKYGIISICFKGYGIGIFVFTGLYTILAFILSFDNAVLAYVFGLFFGLQYMYSFAARVFLRNKLFVFSGVVNTLTIAVVNIVLILCFHMGVESLYIAQIAGCFLQCLIVEIRLHLISNTFKKSFDGAKFKAILKFSVPLCIATVSYWLLSGFTKIIINSVCGSDENGLFAIASSLANVAVIAVNVFQFAWNEMAYLMANEDDRTNTYKKCLDLLFSTVWICCAAFCAGISIIFPYFVGEAFSGSAVVIPYLMIGVSANAIAGFLGTLFMTEQKTGFIMVSTFIAAAVNIGLSWLATVHFGLIGSVVVLSVSFFLLMILRVVRVRQKMGVGMSPIAIFSMLFMVISVLLYVFDAGWIFNALYIVVLIPCYILILKNITGIRFNNLLHRHAAAEGETETGDSQDADK